MQNSTFEVAIQALSKENVEAAFHHLAAAARQQKYRVDNVFFQKFCLVAFCFFQSLCMCFMSFFHSLCMCDQIELLLVHSDLFHMLTFFTFCKVLAITIPTWEVASPMGQGQGLEKSSLSLLLYTLDNVMDALQLCQDTFFERLPKRVFFGMKPFCKGCEAP